MQTRKPQVMCQSPSLNGLLSLTTRAVQPSGGTALFLAVTFTAPAASIDCLLTNAKDIDINAGGDVSSQ